MQLKLNKMRVEHLELQTAHQELRDSFAIVKAEAEKKEKELTTQLSSLKKRTTTLWKINMEPENTPLEKETHLPNHHFKVPC